MVSLHDVAKLSGVSKSTVSRVVNDEYGVKAETKIKVMRAVEELGYVVNQVAKDLKSQKTNLVGVIVPRVSSHAIAEGIDALTATFETAGKQVLLANSQLDPLKEIKFIKLFAQKRVEGIAIYATHVDKELAQVIKSINIPVVLIGQDGSLFNIPSVIHDDFRVGFEAGQRLLSTGCQHIGFIGVFQDDIAVDGLRAQGLIQALSCSSASELLFHHHGGFSIESGYEQTLEIMKKYPQTDGIFCATDRIALGAIKALKEIGKIAGDDIKILGVGNDELGLISSPTISTFNYAFDKAGENAAIMLLDLINGNKQVVSKVILSFENINRETC